MCTAKRHDSWVCVPLGGNMWAGTWGRPSLGPSGPRMSTRRSTEQLSQARPELCGKSLRPAQRVTLKDSPLQRFSLA